MQITLPLATIQNMVAKASKGASCNKMLPITGLLAIRARYGVVTMITSDASNYLYVYKKESGATEDFYVVTQVEMFAKLIARMTCAQVTLKVTDSALVVIGNGTYEIELPLNDEGEPIVFPDPLGKVNTKSEEFEAVDLSDNTIRLLMETASASVADTDDVVCYMGFYTGEKVITTDTLKLCSINKKLFKEPALIAPNTVALLDTLGNESIKAYRKGNIVIFESPSASIYSTLMDEVNDYQAETINGLLETEFLSKCVLSKDAILSAMSRLSLFVVPYDNNSIKLTFMKDGLQVEALRMSSTEVIPYADTSDGKSCECTVDIELFQSLVKAVPGTTVIIEYGNEQFLKLSSTADTSVTQLLALVTD